MSTPTDPTAQRFAARSRLGKTLALGGVPVLLFAGLLAASEQLPLLNGRVVVPYVAMMPGPTVDTLSQVDGQPVVEITGAKTYPTTGRLNMTTVSVGSSFGLTQLFSALGNTQMDLVPTERVFPPQVSMEKITELNAAEFSSSENSATLAASRYLGLPVRIQVADLVEGAAAAGIVGKDDQITAINGTPMRDSAAVVEAISGLSAGNEVTLTILKAGESNPQQVQVRLAAAPGQAEGAGSGRMGVLLSDIPQGPDGDISVNYHLSDIGGPSAGLMFSLSVVDQLEPADLTGGRFVAGTGTMSRTGKVGPIGGIRYKIMAAAAKGADVFLVPADNCAEALAAPSQQMTLLKVTSLADAISGLAAYTAGEQPPSCS